MGILHFSEIYLRARRLLDKPTPNWSANEPSFARTRRTELDVKLAASPAAGSDCCAFSIRALTQFAGPVGRSSDDSPASGSDPRTAEKGEEERERKMQSYAYDQSSSPFSERHARVWP